MLASRTTVTIESRAISHMAEEAATEELIWPTDSGLGLAECGLRDDVGPQAERIKQTLEGQCGDKAGDCLPVSIV